MSYKAFLLILLLNSLPIYSLPNPVLLTMENTGSHMLGKCLHLLTGRALHFQENPSYYTIQIDHHTYYNGEIPPHFNLPSNCIFTMIRDPRDHIMSLIFSRRNDLDLTFQTVIDILDELLPQCSLGWNCPYAIPKSKKYPILNQRAPITRNYGHHVNLCENPRVCVIRYENLIGPEGGGASREVQMQEIKKIAHHAQIEVSNEEISQVAKKIFGRKLGFFRRPSGSNFYTGYVGKWKKYFNKNHKEWFKRLNGELLIFLGYEENSNW